MKILYANRIVPDGTPRSAASHPGLFCLPMENFSMKIIYANRIILAPDGTPRSAASHPGLFCLPMSHKKERQA